MRVRVMSDLHLEFRDYRPDVINGEKDMVLVLAGDIMPFAHFRKHDPSQVKFYVDFFQEMCDRHKYVLYVFGNHEFYNHGCFDGPASEYHYFNVFKEQFVKRDNLVLLEQSDFVLGDVAFVGATMFTDFNNADPIVMWDGKRMMNDYRVILGQYFDGNGDGYSLLLPETVLKYHLSAKQKCLELISKHKQDGKKVVFVSHHGIHEFSIDARFRTGRRSEVNYCYVTPTLAKELVDAGASYAIHGHTHVSHVYTVYDTLRVICNPHGYNDENPQFDGNYVFVV